MIRAADSHPGGQQPPRRTMIDLLMVSVSIIWGLNFAVMKSLYAYFDPLAFTLLRFMIAAATMVIIVKLRGMPMRIESRDLPAITGLGMLANTIYQMLFVTGLAHTKAGNAALLTSASPIFAYVSAILLRREHYSHRVLGGILISFAGAGMIMLYGAAEVALGANWKGDLMILAAAVSWGWYTGAAARLVIKYGALRLTLWVMLTGTLLMVPPMLPALLRQNWSAIPVQAWLGFCYSAFLSIVYSYLVWSFALQQVGPSRTAIYSNLTPMAALLGGWLLLREQPAMAHFAGIALILGGILIVRLKKPASFRAITFR